MDRIKDQASKLSQLLLAPETGATYTRTLTLTWAILRETGLLVWLGICLVFVGADWFWNNSIELGRRGRVWYNSLSEKAEGTTSQPLGTTGQSLLEAGKSGANYLLTQARAQLGIQAPPASATPTPTPTPTSTPTPPAPKPAPAPTPVSASGPPAPAPSSATEPPIPDVVPRAEVTIDPQEI
ncbi:MAG TPA: hypothetical protein V6D06_12365 [Trichocoleus sp.]